MQAHSTLYSKTYNQAYMATIITTTQLQQRIGEITASISKKSYIVTNRGEGKMIILPYFDGCDRLVEDYLEDYEMYSNKEKLQKELLESKKSGRSDLVI